MRWEPGPGAHLLLGSNGAGKTSLLESIYLIATTKSFRTPRLEECCRRERTDFALNATVEGEARASLELGWSSTGRWRKLNGSSVEVARYLEVLPVVTWSSFDLKVVDGAPRDRRRFLDQGIVSRSPAAIEVLSRYRQALEQKRELLRRRDVTTTLDLKAWNELLASSSAELIARRCRFLEELESTLLSTLAKSTLELPAIGLRYRPSPNLEDPTAESIMGEFDRLLGRELEEGRVLSGPHRDEVEITWNGVEASKIASAGEKKLLGLLLSAARGRLLSDAGRRPIVLLDDIDAELDRRRLRAVWPLFSFASQIVATSCHDAILETLPEARFWRLRKGAIGCSEISSQEPSTSI